LAFFDFPAEHWIHLSITNPAEWEAPVVRHGGKRTTGAAMCRTRMRPCPDRRLPPRERQTGTETRPRFRAGAKDGHCLSSTSIHYSAAGPRNVTPGSGNF
jgi:hypothetical protein